SSDLVPLEDYRKLALIVALAAHCDLAMPQARSLLASYENAVSRFIDSQGASQCHPSLYPIDSRPAADAI
ncbi:opine metallophore biosynthesis dehydrogenase, partial [Pseudomonas aeruginosa]|uniref:opine metallophore biosynthesis dehydrogenase n=1 Tax=Pseudomonas aeruginosa TaxID=287 RepID=UPI002884FE96